MTTEEMEKRLRNLENVVEANRLGLGIKITECEVKAGEMIGAVRRLEKQIKEIDDYANRLCASIETVNRDLTKRMNQLEQTYDKHQVIDFERRQECNRRWEWTKTLEKRVDKIETAFRTPGTPVCYPDMPPAPEPGYTREQVLDIMTKKLEECREAMIVAFDEIKYKPMPEIG